MKTKFAILSALLCLVSTLPAQSVSPLQLKQIFVATAENSFVKGDTITLQFNQPMNRANWVDGRISHSAQTTPKAPAGYSEPAGSQSAVNAARNYTVKITPGPGSKTHAYTGTWASLGGTALYEPQDSSIVYLLPPNPRTQVFAPGDQVELIAVNTLTSPDGTVIDPSKLQHKAPAS
ncbi:hypothetical protein COW36_20700 [bacterium (Candidatus Blackallbacteria) CG17_big_fil_post_rev_8_21_14_2_50_48_46]|uniref:Uncharacterized protein n=1 Tax=bacterium (Candidatus Blackallbacteria) CG17_big_fil_post_rev_8_21_14_2_50_48_46 TaxID=2014261 RepID=A0A2M7FYW8_9BACT|nr:MAG: hypothetical protein COW64_14010 [bacterium (Candidatus Blackallbacteria) CG18_big_fil_WC_8_21_14_2_50_49_26]PIW14462.1 MAG: hypothetical protein COW36_20700 [bacterium (Candidatus Blackallbacteria) CG17_big_fil_post_rev_8_21_14_2_50_48_46]PIW47148.1 MAG: hypothetical protein COW20_13145 [bacterium (Candidatus Blackallbacteria) CG13_big_fil_rev_8_21_14_2_50_49_14]